MSLATPSYGREGGRVRTGRLGSVGCRRVASAAVKKSHVCTSRNQREHGEDVRVARGRTWGEARAPLHGSVNVRGPPSKRAGIAIKRVDTRGARRKHKLLAVGAARKDSGVGGFVVQHGRPLCHRRAVAGAQRPAPLRVRPAASQRRPRVTVRRACAGIQQRKDEVSYFWNDRFGARVSPCCLVLLAAVAGTRRRLPRRVHAPSPAATVTAHAHRS